MTRKIIIFAVIILVLALMYNLWAQIMTALKSGERLSQAAETVFKLEAKNKELKEKLAQIKSPQYIEEQARNKLGLSKGGETIVIIPEDKLRQILGASQSAQIRLPNWLGWWKMFF